MVSSKRNILKQDLLSILDGLGRKRGLDREVLLKVLEEAILSASRKSFASLSDIEVSIDRVSGEIKVFSEKKEVALGNFGRIAAQIARQVISQRLNEAERDSIYNEFKEKVGGIITGVVERFERGDVIVMIGEREAIVHSQERPAGERFRVGERITAYVLEVKKSGSYPQIILSRSNPGMVRGLFELEVPEIHEGIVEIKSIAREPGSRSKVAVGSTLANVDPVGACVGARGMRVKAIMQQLNGEKVDIIHWDEKIENFIANALRPAKIMKIEVNEKRKAANIIVSDEELSLAIGKGGQNVRLAVELTGWKISIEGETEVIKARRVAIDKLTKLSGVGERLAENLIEAGLRELEEIATADIKRLTSIAGIGKSKADALKKAAEKVV
ncbi:transcription termination/antitermination protein NusA [candidate division NPL-UPA2 bacterium Unc8]|uniref:Transcription termination/antitermination protein NusA n=1 Tax=candidate division NPL-UPA2 bacterium Unc8 TaxID=1980939 RepID=A0A399FWA8_UNCN2|nr:Transcription termination/antitermination protein NusA [Bacillota bacterium]MBT9137826.1 Transcription termination/antitermination protein NusA [Bacillota bacterium]MBT9146289.1 Transcription termination/antitermination protein NusA [Bacillota bacterium]RII00715.1 MAG: transcription termination/antitermination protein NusA [candidate division NPL-UPA2 bacterium Unc8]